MVSDIQLKAFEKVIDAYLPDLGPLEGFSQDELKQKLIDSFRDAQEGKLGNLETGILEHNIAFAFSEFKDWLEFDKGLGDKGVEYCQPLFIWGTERILQKWEELEKESGKEKKVFNFPIK